jgi:hypothetical protein|tara:strand:- start:24 stop:635 length:612 start_codon:yes stop_codon:yes gene_type:complete
MKEHLRFILQNSIIFAGISFGFSIIGGLFPDSEYTSVLGNPFVVSGITIEHIMGHIFWGAIIGLGTLSIRYIILGGSFAILLDADHLLQFLDIELVARMSHSIPFAIIAAIVFFIILRGKDLRIIAVVFGAILSHIAFDVFLADIAFDTSTTFPLFSPFMLDRIELAGLDWLWIEIIGISIVAVTSYLFKKKENKLENNLTKT